jgi:hypothetical protein
MPHSSKLLTWIASWLKKRSRDSINEASPDPGSINLRKPTQCVLWDNPETVDVSAKMSFECVEEIIEESHLSRYVLKCGESGQLYFYEFYEVVDWKDGNDKQYTTYIPVDTPEQIEALKASSVFDLLRFFPRLQGTSWVGK